MTPSTDKLMRLPPSLPSSPPDQQEPTRFLLSPLYGQAHAPPSLSLSLRRTSRNPRVFYCQTIHTKHMTMEYFKAFVATATHLPIVDTPHEGARVGDSDEAV